MKTRVTEIFGIKYPIVHGGFSCYANARLAASVSNAGGLGQITAVQLRTPEKLREEIRKVVALTDKPFSINFAFVRHDEKYMELLEVAIEEKVPVITITGANPQPVFERLKGENIRTLVLVSGVRQAQKAEALGADAVIAVGQRSVRNLGRDDTRTIALIPRIMDSVSIPVIASGRIADERGLMAARAFGVEGTEVHALSLYRSAFRRARYISRQSFGQQRLAQ